MCLFLANLKFNKLKRNKHKQRPFLLINNELDPKRNYAGTET